MSFGFRQFSGPSKVLSKSPFMECMRHGPSEKRNKKKNYVMKTDMAGGGSGKREALGSIPSNGEWKKLDRSAERQCHGTVVHGSQKAVIVSYL